MGGPSSEHDVSLKSGEVVLRELSKGNHFLMPVIIDRGGNWPIEPEDLPHRADIAFIAMHGEYGEDGTIQEMLSDIGMPYTGSHTLPSSLAMNKVLANRVFEAHGIKVPRHTEVHENKRRELNLGSLDFPLVVKPIDRGSSVGVSLVRSFSDLDSAIDRAFGYSKSAMLQEYISGRELTCSVLDDGLGDVMPLSVIEIRPKMGNFFDYNSKYGQGGSEYVVPARLDSRDFGLAQAIAVRAHQSIGAHGFSRTDMILGEDGHIYVLEINTIPGMTEHSLLPRAALSHGISLQELFERIIEAGLRRHRMENNR